MLLVYVPIEALLNWVFQLPREEARVSGTEAQVSRTEAQLSDFSQALTNVCNTLEAMRSSLKSDEVVLEKHTDNMTKALERIAKQEGLTEMLVERMEMLGEKMEMLGEKMAKQEGLSEKLGEKMEMLGEKMAKQEGLSEKLVEITSSNLRAMDNLIKRIEDLDLTVSDKGMADLSVEEDPLVPMVYFDSLGVGVEGDRPPQDFICPALPGETLNNVTFTPRSR